MHWLVSTTTMLILGVIYIIFPDFEFTISNTMIIIGMILIVASHYDCYEDQRRQLPKMLVIEKNVVR
ncbi:Protein CBG27912 [Caenorhabditis briggsae]|uniref:Uncharacterized protein n=2 Tax=Caenorhabditis briggsae TaxID=6238 RepID=A0AAE8ZZS0_CAEBR|nr:Protein CBG27912 [Caenorhabditis briggsae]ULT83656.1 hypothetical protein L3Y34_012717 [Caenorhabditis briggsae]CAR98337.1 Protein CBG27912 [Caenorhabditis briggsae]